MNDDRGVMILIDHQHRHEAVAGVGQRDRDRARIEIENGSGIQRVTVHADDDLLIDQRELAIMMELSEAASLGDDIAEI